MKKYILKINYLQIILHLTATAFFIFSSQNFSAIYNFRIFRIISENGVQNAFRNSEKYGISMSDISSFLFTTSISSIIAIFVAFILSVIISIKKKWSLWNSIIVLIISFVLNRFQFLSVFYQKEYLSPSYFINDLFISFLTSGSFFLTIGLIIFLSKYLNKVIENQKQKLTEN